MTVQSLFAGQADHKFAQLTYDVFTIPSDIPNFLERPKKSPTKPTTFRELLGSVAGTVVGWVTIKDLPVKFKLITTNLQELFVLALDSSAKPPSPIDQNCL